MTYTTLELNLVKTPSINFKSVIAKLPEENKNQLVVYRDTSKPCVYIVGKNPTKTDNTITFEDGKEYSRRHLIKVIFN